MQTNIQHVTDVSPVIKFLDSFGFDKPLFLSLSLGAIWL
jgi:hypothetical protein